MILPRWIGKEVTGDLLYKKINMRALLNGSSPGALVPTAGANAMTIFGMPIVEVADTTRSMLDAPCRTVKFCFIPRRHYRE